VEQVPELCTCKFWLSTFCAARWTLHRSDHDLDLNLRQCKVWPPVHLILTRISALSCYLLLAHNIQAWFFFVCGCAVTSKCTCRCKCMRAQKHTSLPVLHCLGRSGHCLGWHQRQEAQGCPLRWHLWGCLRRTWLSNCRHQT